MTSVAERNAGGTQLTAAGIAAFLDADWMGPDATVRGTDALDRAGPDDLSFCVYEDAAPIRESDAGVVVCSEAAPALPDRTLVRSPRPKFDFVRVARKFFQPDDPDRGVHRTAVVEDGAEIGEDVLIGPNAYVGEDVRIGDRCAIQAGTTLGTPGFGFVRDDDDRLLRQPHQGAVVVEDDVAIGANCSIDRAVFGETVVGRGAKISGNVHVAHQVAIGEDVTVASGCSFAGGATVGARAEIHPGASVATDVSVGADAEVGMNSTVLDDVSPDTTVVGSPARPVEGE